MALTIIPKYSGDPLEPASTTRRLSTPWLASTVNLNDLYGYFIASTSVGDTLYWDASHYLECSCGSGGGVSGDYILKITDIGDIDNSIWQVNETGRTWGDYNSYFGLYDSSVIEDANTYAQLTNFLSVDDASVIIGAGTVFASGCSGGNCTLVAESKNDGNSYVGLEAYDVATDREGELNVFPDRIEIGDQDNIDGSIYLAGNGLYWNGVEVSFGATGATALSQLTDVSIVDVSNNNIIEYNSALGVWQNASSLDVSVLDASLYFLYKTTDTFTGTLQIDGSLRVGTYNTNYLEIGKDGTLKLYGNATAWDDLVVPLTTTRVGALSKPDFDYDEVAFMFPQNVVTEILYFVVQLPHKWKTGSRLHPHVHYRQKEQSNKPTFKLDYKLANIGSSMPNTWKTYTMDTSVVSWVDSSTHQLAIGASGIDASSYTLSAMMLCKLYRDDNVVSGDVPTWQFDIHYEIDSFGSSTEYVK